MKAVCIVGSPRKNGSTALIAETFAKAFEEKFYDVRRFFLGESDIKYCMGCKKCYENGRCIQKDDVEEIVLSILDADYVVVVTPSYWGDVTGQLKVLFDRSTPFCNTNPSRTVEYTYAKGIAVSVRAGTHKEENEKILDTIAHYFGHMEIDTIVRLSICGVDSVEDLISKHRDILEGIKGLIPDPDM